jgi:uncharacterized protein
VKKLLVAFASGVVFAVGLGVSGMTHPSKILAFLDLAGDWDASLALVMGSGVIVNLALFQWVLRRGAPLLTARFSLPPPRPVDAGLTIGSALFGVGWGLGGFCPGPAIVATVSGAAPVIAFTVTMLVTMGLFDVSVGRRFSGAAAEPEV